MHDVPKMHDVTMMHDVDRSPQPFPDDDLEAPARPVDREPVVAADTDGWHPGPLAAAVTAAKPVAFAGGNARILVLRTKGELRAFRNACAHVGLPLERGMCDVAAGTITCPWHGFRFDADTGACLSAPSCRLEPFPLRVSAGVVWVRPS